MRVEELDYFQRQDALRQIREKLGETSYQQLVSQVGEDGLLEVVLKNSGPGVSSQPKEESSFWGKVGTFFGVLLFFIFFYIQALNLLSGGKSPSVWAYLGAIPVGAIIFFAYVYLQNVIVWIFTYLTFPIASIWILAALISNHASLWGLLEGVVCLIAGAIFMSKLSSSDDNSLAWGFNGLVGYVMGVVSIIAGLAAHFIWHM
jgi:hypothetical protein